MRYMILTLVMLSVGACSGTIDRDHMGMNMSRQGENYAISGRYGPGWSESDIRSEAEAACRARSMRLSRFEGQLYSKARGTQFSAQCSPRH